MFDEIWNGFNADQYPPGLFGLPPDSVSRNGSPTFLNNGCYEFGHGNSLGYVASEDAYYTNWRWLDVTMKIARSGDLMWQWGGAFADLPGDAATLFEHSHFSEVWAGGMMMFDKPQPPESDRGWSSTPSTTPRASPRSGATTTPRATSRTSSATYAASPSRAATTCSSAGRARPASRRSPALARSPWDVTSPVVGNVTSRLFFIPDLYDMTGIGNPD